MHIVTTTLSELFSNINNKTILLPNFQRDFVWDQEKIQSLLASILVNLSFGVALTIEGNVQKFKVREIGSRNNIDICNLSNTYCKFLLDGQQRITSIYSIFNDIFNGQDHQNIYEKLRYRWYLKLENEETDIFGYKYLNFNDSSAISKLTTDDILDYIEYQKINFNKPEIDSDIKEYCITNKCLPLWWLGNESKSNLLRGIISSISKNREDEITEQFDYKPESRFEIFSNCCDKDYEYYSNYCEEIKTRPNLSSTDKEYKNNVLDLIRDYLRSSSWIGTIQTYLKNLLKQDLNFISLAEDEMDRAINIFSAMNEGGQPLKPFDLVVAKSVSIDGAEVKQTIAEKLKDEFNSLCETTQKLDPFKFQLFSKEEFNSNFTDNLLTLISAFSQVRFNPNQSLSYLNELNLNSIGPKYALRLSGKEITDYFPFAKDALIRTFDFIHKRCGVPHVKAIQYNRFIIPITLALACNEVYNDPKKLNILEAWYWASMFAGKYSRAQNKRSNMDIYELKGILSYESRAIDDFSKLRSCQEVNGFKMFDYAKYCDFDSLYKNESNEKIKNVIIQFIYSNYLRRNNLPDCYEDLKIKKNKNFFAYEILLNSQRIWPDSDIQITDENLSHELFNKIKDLVNTRIHTLLSETK